jgi:peptidoglycan-associated lipoprotein
VHIHLLEEQHMRSMTLGGAVLFLGLAGCAHAPRPEVTEMTRTEAPPPAPAKPQLVAAPQGEAIADPNREVEAALKSATILFDFNSDQLKPEGMEALQKVSRVLRHQPGLVIKIEGNCDERGTEEYNLLLGQRRADTARRYLATLGVSPQQLDSVSYGAMKPVNPAHSEDAWAQNRRDELHASR